MNRRTRGGNGGPRATLDAGGETWLTLSDIVCRRLEELAAGDILEIISLEPSTATEIPAWCAASGHLLAGITVDGDVTRFSIEKGGS